MLNQTRHHNKSFIDPNLIDEDFINLFNKPGPYYSSYPILGEWKSVTKSFNHEKTLIEYFKENPRNPMHLYLHIPYCAKLCYYCSCRIHISNKREVINDFVKLLVAEINMLEKFFIENKIKPNIKEIHLGGGTPSHLTVDELSLIIGEIKKFTNI